MVASEISALNPYYAFRLNTAYTSILAIAYHSLVGSKAPGSWAARAAPYMRMILLPQGFRRANNRWIQDNVMCLADPGPAS